jgi:hypothetical protein
VAELQLYRRWRLWHSLVLLRSWSKRFPKRVCCAAHGVRGTTNTVMDQHGSCAPPKRSTVEWRILGRRVVMEYVVGGCECFRSRFLCDD